MTSLDIRRGLATVFVAVFLPTCLAPGASKAEPGSRQVEPGQVVPLDLIPPRHREAVAEVIRDHTLHRRAPADTFPCHSKVYLSLLNEPLVTLALWQDLATSPVQLRQLGAGQYSGSDGAGASATWEFIVRTPKVHVLMCHLDYTSPRGSTKLQGRIVLIVHSGFYKEVNGEPWVQHDVEAYVKVDTKGWKTLARTARPILESVLEDQVHEAGMFVSLMGRLVEAYPDWACRVVDGKPAISPETREGFRETVSKNRRKGASTGRPTLVENASQPPARRR